MTVLVVADHNNSELQKATLCSVTAALAIDEQVDLLVVGHNCRSVAEEGTRLRGVQEVCLVDASCYEHALAENLAPLVVELADQYSHILTSHTTTGKNFLPRVAAMLDVQMISDIIEIVSPDTFIRPIYAGSALATIQSNDQKKVLSIRSTAFDPVSCEEGGAEIIELDTKIDNKMSYHIRDELPVSERPDLDVANIVISGGRGLGSKENFQLLEEVADILGAALGASRAAVDAGFVPNDMQVGQTGKIVAPDLYIAIGISGAIQHLAGMKDAKVIVAINKDPDAPIFQISDYGLVADLFQAIPEMKAAIQKQ